MIARYSPIMDVVDFPSLLLTILFTLLVVKLGIKLRTNKNSGCNLPPGPWKLPLIGNLYHIIGSRPPHQALAELAKKYGPVMHFQMGEVPTILVSSPETAKEILQTHDINFASRPLNSVSEVMTRKAPNIIFSPYGEMWRQLRKICVLELLSIRRVRSFRFIREEETSNLMRRMAEGGSSSLPVNLTADVASSVYSTTARVAFGKKSPEQEAFISKIQEIAVLAAGFNVADMFPSFKFVCVVTGMKARLEGIHKKIDSILTTIIKEHKEAAAGDNNPEKNAQKDLVDVLLEYEEAENHEFSLTLDSIKTVLLDVYFAGTDSSVATIDWAMSEMMKNPRIMEKAQEEVRQVFKDKGEVDEESFDKLKYLKSIIRETLRLHPAGPLIIRQSNEQCKIGSYEIPAKSKVFVNVWAINRDPLYWKDADTFYPERFLLDCSSVDYYKGASFEYIPFGAGRRICAGVQFGIANVELHLAKLLYHFDWYLPNGIKPEELDMTEAAGLVVKRKHNLHLIPVLRNPLL
ncbi:OLC1v1005342C1 [Oldenlandia corymbosa var. corymbosa]|uniref:OLC1v1005342C1 n=1 Tax=Oldenlandia corymbosa var. corymbosa TaxID=529605 RepID=A0AAV1DHB2_OLDCO|nr:OLC1v1005342C1 [Oldenlandia corymbosa var. corymbosa]